MDTITLQNSMTLKELQTTFQAAFPNLKLEFFTEPHKAEAGSPKAIEVPEQWDETIVTSSIKATDKLVEVAVKGAYTVEQLEKDLEYYFGLHAQVFRKSGDTWLETTRTDNLTLAEQNQKAADHEFGAQVHENPYELKERPDFE